MDDKGGRDAGCKWNGWKEMTYGKIKGQRESEKLGQHTKESDVTEKHVE